MSRTSPSDRRGYVAIALASCAVLILEIAFTRVLSVVLWYHFAFLSVSLAMLGIGAPGVWFALRPPGERALKWSLLGAAIAVPAGLVGIVRVGAYLPRVEGMVGGGLDIAQARVLLTVACTLVPLIALGCAVVILLLRATGPAFGRMYAADLAGAAVGAFAAVPLMSVVPTPQLVVLCGVLPLVAAVVVLRPLPRWTVVIAAVLAGLLAWGEPFHLHYTKTYEESDVLWEKWTPTARITVFPRPFWTDDPTHAFGWGMGSKFVPYPVEQLWIEQDGSAGTPVTKLDRPLEQLTHLLYDVTSAAYQMRPPDNACVIGSGGGRDVLTALRSGAKTVDAVELNGGIVEAVSGPFRDFSGDVYNRPGVTAHVGEGRSFLTRNDRRWDLIQISLIDSWSATSAGAYALSENNLYTVEAVRLYLRRLTPEGVLSISRWVRVWTQLDTPRVALLVLRALELEGAGDPKAHIAVVQGGNIATVIASKTPIGPEDVTRLDAACAEKGFERLWPPTPDSVRESLITSVIGGGTEALTELGFDLQPPTDDRPFFFQMVPIFRGLSPVVASHLSVNDSAVVILRWLMGAVGAVAVALFLLPFAVTRRLPRGPGFWRGSLYFAAIGVAFLFVEAALIQKFILYLGHPSHATTVVLAAVLLGAGAGSFAATRVTDRLVDRGRFALPLAAGAMVPVLPLVFATTLGWPLAVRIGISLIVLLPVAFLMGFAFPVGVARFGEERKAWFWAINGVTGVLAGVTSLALAIAAGFSSVIGAGAVVYLAACLLLPRAHAV